MYFGENDTVLFCGEGNFSFSASILTANKNSRAKFWVTCYEKEENISEEAQENLDSIRDNNGTILHSLDATRLHEDNRLTDLTFTHIIFNFPHTGTKMKINLNRELLQKFFKSASQKIETPEGKVIVTLCQGQGGTPFETRPRECYGDTWQIIDMAAYGGFGIFDVVPFDYKAYPGYTCVGYRNLQKQFHLENALTHVLQKTQVSFEDVLQGVGDNMYIRRKNLDKCVLGAALNIIDAHVTRVEGICCGMHNDGEFLECVLNTVNFTDYEVFNTNPVSYMTISEQQSYSVAVVLFSNEPFEEDFWPKLCAKVFANMNFEFVFESEAYDHPINKIFQKRIDFKQINKIFLKRDTATKLVGVVCKNFKNTHFAVLDITAILPFLFEKTVYENPRQLFAYGGTITKRDDEFIAKPPYLFPSTYTFDLSFWESDKNLDLHDFFRDKVSTNDLVIDSKLADSYECPNTHRTSKCYRITYQSFECPMTHEQCVLLHQTIGELIELQYDVIVR